ncbi:MAG: MBL fold metallo-hydrolase [Deltaproteobacteria bacterium]|nr:MBL fold metallo-hydrolase [Deltaproteobacteria bacterium]
MSHQKTILESEIKPKNATEYTKKTNSAALDQLPFEDRRSFENAARGFIASVDEVVIRRPDDRKITFDLTGLAFLSGPVPDTVNPSLWRQSQLNALYHGLFEVIDGIYQVRSFDLANMTLIRGNTGWVIVDPLTSAESARAALDLANKHLGARPVTGIIYTHSHADHFFGVTGVIDSVDAESGKIPILAPRHFVKEALSENIMAGNVMQRRATYMYGNLLPQAPDGFVGDGLGANLSMGTTGFIAPNDTINETGEIRVVDGIEIVFQMTPDTEAVSEFIFYLPQFKALCTAEITSHHLHNIYTPRGAQVRDALAWSDGINEAINLFGNKMEVQFATHHWPTWGREAVIDYLEKQRDLYKYIHDQTLRLANHGYTKEEIAEQLALPESLAKDFSCRGYYGTVSHNAKAVYVKYLGYFDGNPANLNPLPPVEASRHYLEYMGGAEAVIEKARRSFAHGDYRWTAQVMNHVVMAEPDNIEAQILLADVYEQLGYQAESAPWRNFYLTGALELRQGVPAGSPARISEVMAKGIPLENFFQSMAMRLNGPKADGKTLSFNLFFTDTVESWLLFVKNAVFHAFPNRRDQNASAALRLSSLDFKLLMIGLRVPHELIESGKMTLEGNAGALMAFAELFDQFNRRFPLVTPRER